jgi:hypothetical protein
MDLDIQYLASSLRTDVSTVLTSVKYVGYEDTGKNGLTFPYPDTCGNGFYSTNGLN